MRIGILFLVLTLILSCEEAGKEEIYNENNTIVKDGIVYNIEERPINGIYKIYYPDGTVKMEIESYNGLPNGVGKFFTAAGNLQYEAEFSNGVLNGVLRNYYPDGQIHNEQMYQNGILHGAQKVYDIDGNQISEIVYDKGVAVNGHMFIKDEKIEFTVDELAQF